MEYLPPELCRVHLENNESGNDNDVTHATSNHQISNLSNDYSLNSDYATTSYDLKQNFDSYESISSSTIPDDRTQSSHYISNSEAARMRQEERKEQASNALNIDRYDHRFDIYTAGALLYEMLIGHSPFAGPEYANKYVYLQPKLYPLALNKFIVFLTQISVMVIAQNL